MKYAPVLVTALLGCANTVTPTGPAGDAGAPVDLPAAPTDARSPLDAPDAQRPDVVIPSVDGGATLTDDCARGTWCWERPLPTGERAADARVFSPTDVVYVTVGGTLARWDGVRWRTAMLSLPAPVRSMWAQRNDEVYLLCVDDNTPGGMQRSWLVRVRGITPEVLGGPVPGFASTLVGTAPDDLWALNNRGLLRWNGAAWSVVPGPGDVLLSGLHAQGPNDLLVLENWGSGSGTGRLHRFNGTDWSLLTSFQGLRVRVEAPIVSLRGAIYLRAWNSNESQPEIVRYELATGQSSLITPPVDDGSVEVYAVGDALWASYGGRLWRREGERWIAMPNLPNAYGARILTSNPQDVWFFGQSVARLQEGGWRSFTTALDGAAGFWRDATPTPALVSVRPAGLARFIPGERGVWPVRSSAGVDGQQLLAWAPAGGDRGWLATERLAVEFVNREDVGAAGWPAGGRMQGPFAAWERTLWIAAEGGIRRLEGGQWLAPVAVPRVIEAPQQEPTVRAMHGVGANAVLFSTELVTGDKQVYVNLHVLRGETASAVGALRGVFGSSAAVHFAGALPSVWISFDGLRIWNGEGVRPVADITPLDVHVLPDGRAVGTDGERVYVWTADGRTVGSVPIPRVSEVRWSFVHGEADGTLRVAAGGGEVLRYTP